MVPLDIEILGVIVSPPPLVAEVYFDDPECLPDLLDQYVEYLATHFPRITSWEVGNEPNASDFYLSVKTEEGHRPWTAKEYVKHFLLPGIKSLKQRIPEVKICVSGVAEDGMVGHDDRPPALSNRIPKNDKYAKYLSSSPHGHFYFIPQFTVELMVALDEILKENQAENPNNRQNLVDAIAFHPYPYFKIHKKTSPIIADCTLEMIDSFSENSSQLRQDHHLELWITEVGARSFDLCRRNYRDETQQAEFF